MIKFVDELLDRITTYRLVLYYLVALLAIAVALAAFNVLPHGAKAIAFSTALILAACRVTN